MDLDNAHTRINIALIDSAIKRLEELKAKEMTMQLNGVRSEPIERQAKLHGEWAINAMRMLIDYLNGVYSVTDTASLTKALELEEKEPQFLELAEKYQEMCKEQEGLKKALAKAERAKKKSAKKPKKKKAKNNGELVCSTCGRVCKSKAGLARHFASCKG
jgi:hypothetical protein